jgi:hypothetical protein
MEGFKSALFDLSHRLQKVEAEGGSDPEAEARCHTVLGELNGSLSEFGRLMAGSGYEEVAWGYVFKEIFPISCAAASPNEPTSNPRAMPAISS